MILLLISKKMGLETLKLVYDTKKTIKVLTIDDKNDLRSEYDAISKFCQSNKIDLKISNSKKNTSEFLLENKFELCIVVCWYQLIESKVIEKNIDRIIGIHNSLLPKYRGGSPLVWSIINGEKYFGYTIFSISKGIDDGKVWLQKKFKLSTSHSIIDCLKIIENSFYENINKLVSDILNNKIKPCDQDLYHSSFCSQRIPEDGHIKWDKNPLKIYNFIRAQSYPYPGAFTIYNSNKIIIEKSSISEIEIYSSPGQIVRIVDNGVLIGCKNNRTLLIEKVRVNDDLNIVDANKIFKHYKARLS